MSTDSQRSGLAKALAVATADLGSHKLQRVPVCVMVAAGGIEHIIEVTAETRVGEFQEKLDNITGVRAADQILLAGRLRYKTLESRTAQEIGALKLRRQSAPSSDVDDSDYSNTLQDGSQIVDSTITSNNMLYLLPHGPFAQMSVAKKVLSYTGLENSISISSDYPGLDITCGIFGQAQVTFLGVVFMYDRRTLSSRALLKPLRALEEKYVSIPSQISAASNSESHPIINSSSLSGDPLLAAVAAAERQFYLHLKQGLAWESRAKSRLQSCQKSIRSQWIKLHSLTAAIGNLSSFSEKIKSYIEQFVNEVCTRRKKEKELLLAFPADLNFLKRVVLHENLSSGGRTTLYDFCPTERLKCWASDCNRFDAILNEKLGQFNASFSSLQNDVDSIMSDTQRSSFRLKLLNFSTKLSSFNLKNIEGVFTKAIEELRNDHLYLDTILTNEMSSDKKKNLMEVVREIGATRDVHMKKIFPKFSFTVDDMLMRILKSLSNLNLEISSFHFNELRRISKCQASLSALKRQKELLSSAVNGQSNRVQQLLPIKMMPSAYATCLAEVARRRAHNKMIISEVKHIAKKMSHLRSIEIGRREVFLRKYGRYIPADLIPGLSNPRPASVEIGVCCAKSDSELPDVDIDSSTAKLYDHLGLSNILLSAIKQCESTSDAIDDKITMIGDLKMAKMSTLVGSLKLMNATLRQEIITRFGIEGAYIGSKT